MWIWFKFESRLMLHKPINNYRLWTKYFRLNLHKSKILKPKEGSISGG